MWSIFHFPIPRPAETPFVPPNIFPIPSYNIHMADSKDILEHQYLEMRWRALSLAADLDRIQRGAGGAQLLKSDPRAIKLRKVFEILLTEGPDRAERVQMILSDMSPPPGKS